jgi:hypothetical protein
VRILTVRQPWAWAIIHGGKDVENRVRNIAGGYRGPVAIHVGRAYDHDWQSASLDDAMRPVRNGASPAAQYPWPWQGSLGAIIGVVDLVDVHRPLWDDSCSGDGEGMCSPWAELGAYHLVLANPRPLTEPIPYRGALGLRNLAVNDPTTYARILAQIGAAA